MFLADVYIEDGVIRYGFFFYLFGNFRQVGSNLTIPGGVRIIDVRGKMVMPGTFWIEFLLKFQEVLIPIHTWRCPSWALFPPMISTRALELLWLGAPQ